MRPKYLLSILFALFLVLDSSISVSAEESDIVSDSTQQFNSIFTSEEYWTEEKMKDAIPVENVIDYSSEDKASESKKEKLDEKFDVEPALPESNKFNITPNAIVPSSTGKLFFTDPSDGLDYVCSASSANNPNKNLVTTAGHCVHDGNGGNFYTNIIFVPAYYEGSTPYGIWDVHWKVTFKGWTESGNYDYDQAFLTVFPENGRNLVNVVGGNGLSFNYDQAQKDVRITGYPAEDPYPGDIPYSCYGDTKKASGNDAKMSCGFTRGASGGAWFRTMSSDNVGHIFAVTSRKSVPRGTLYARPFTSDYKDLYESMVDK